MLRITITETATEQRWTLEGHLVEPWVGELRISWKNRHRPHNGRTCTVDLGEVAFTDNSGLRLLQTMSKEGTRFIATGIYTKHVLEQLRIRTKRGPTNWMLGLFGGFLAGVIACSSFMNVRNAKQEFRAHLNPSIELNTSTSDFTDGRVGTPCPHS